MEVRRIEPAYADLQSVTPNKRKDNKGQKVMPNVENLVKKML
jgi:hypothetical protein